MDTVVAQLAQTSLPVGTQVIQIYCHGLCLNNGQPNAEAFCGLFFFDGCEYNQGRRLSVQHELKIATTGTAAVVAVLNAIKVCEPLLAEWPKTCPLNVNSLFPSTPSRANAIAAAAAAATVGARDQDQDDQKTIMIDEGDDEEARTNQSQTQQHSPQQASQSQPPLVPTRQTVKLFSAGTVAPFLPPGQRQPAGSTKQPVVIIIFTDSEYVTKSLSGNTQVLANRHVLLPLQVLCLDFNVFVLRCPASSFGIRQASALAHQAHSAPLTQSVHCSSSSSSSSSAAPVVPVLPTVFPSVT